MAKDIYMQSLVENPVEVENRYHHYNSQSLITQRQASTFAPKPKDHVEEEEQSKKRTFEICTEEDSKIPEQQRKRRLVSLFEANEVAKRVTSLNRHSGGGNQVVVNGGVVEEGGKPDIVSEWLGDF
ncbi:hypothetical protein B0J14DRAFT_216976 [Halenospora varia]|nr:hypothetical protein B0J14DRAFT_216976 [Halenospora varia]